ncbi:ABC-three component system middle component 2 [Haloferula sp.]|jgi:hypothetical protein|uniref:ABC-three component system middle component 2 n=1 Tax=Haloferula sp. TaxID=2497595 RepID=UPI003C70912F
MEKMNPSWIPDNRAWESPFNTPLECGLRCALLLVEAFPASCDLQRLIHYDYLLVHSGDVENGPPSIHPATPHRTGELHVRRRMIERGLHMMMSKSVIECCHSEAGITYKAGTWALTFIGALRASYTQSLRDSSSWVISSFGGMSNEDLKNYIAERWERWGPEFTQSTLSLISE